MKEFILEIITKTQKLLLSSDMEIAAIIYYKLADIHFKLHFGVSLEDEILNDSEIAHMAAKRHSRLVLKVIYPDTIGTFRKVIRKASIKTFKQNFILNARL